LTESGEKQAALKMLRLVGLGVRGRGAIVGVEQVRESARRGKLHLAVTASDAARNSIEKVAPLLKARGVAMLTGPSAAELGAAVGREKAAVVGIVDSRLAAGIRALFESAPPDESEEELG
jgi:ribosomal protein L7Ae-like RNA K-turn-binding protein